MAYLKSKPVSAHHPKAGVAFNKSFLHYPAVRAFIQLLHLVDKAVAVRSYGEAYRVRSARRAVHIGGMQ